MKSELFTVTSQRSGKINNILPNKKSNPFSIDYLLDLKPKESLVKDDDIAKVESSYVPTLYKNLNRRYSDDTRLNLSAPLKSPPPTPVTPPSSASERTDDTIGR